MPRRPRVLVDGSTYHVYCRCPHSTRVFASPEESERSKVSPSHLYWQNPREVKPAQLEVDDAAASVGERRHLAEPCDAGSRNVSKVQA